MKKILAFVLAFSPLFASAQQLRDINSISTKAISIGNLIIQLAISLAVLWIIVSVVRYLIAGADDEEARKKGGQAILWGVVGLAVILSIWGLVSILTNSFQFDNSAAQRIDNVKIPPLPPVQN